MLLKCLRLLRHAGYWSLDWVASLGVAREESNSVALVRVDAIGDFVLWLGSANLLRNHFLECRLLLICNDAVAELARRCGHFDDVVAVDLNAFTHNPFYRWKMIRSVRLLHATVAVQCTYSRVFSTGDALIRATGAAKRIGSVGDLSNMRQWQRWIADRSYSDLIPSVQSPLMELERNCEFLRGIGIENANPTVATLPQVSELSPPLRIPRDYFIVFPGASSTKRMWPAEKFGASARAIGKLYGWQMVVCGTASESELACSVIDHATLPEPLNLAGKTSLPELVELVRGARLLISNETSAIHIAAAVGTPSVGILGGGHFGRFMPYSPLVAGVKPVAVFEPMECFGCNWHCIKSHKKNAAVPCIAAVQVEAVLHAAHLALANEETTDVAGAT